MSEPVARSSPAPRVRFTAGSADGRTAGARLVSIDRLRGLMVVLMVLDHVREFMHRDALLFQPTDLDRTNAVLFATRWVTHLCAPTFVLLAGVSIRLQRDRGAEGLARHLVARGLWLLLLEATVISFGFDLGGPFLFLQVIWAIGIGMLVMAASLRLKPTMVLVSAIAVFLTSGVLPAGAFGPFTFLLTPGPTAIVPGLVAYPPVPWAALLAVGYGAGHLFLPDAWRGRSAVPLAGLALLGCFVVLRVAGAGDPSPWQHRPDVEGTVLSFLNVSKYPPSPAFVCATLGVSLTLSPLLRWLPWPLSSITDAFGRTPFFTYLLHIYAAHLLAVAVGVALGFKASIFTGYLQDPSRLVAAGWGVGLGWVYVAWMSVVVALWPAARWFAAVKRRGGRWWLRYL